MRELGLKALLVVIIIAGLGPPLTATAEVLALLAAILLITLGSLVIPAHQRLRQGAAVIALCLLAKFLLPAIKVQEGHNVFLVDGDKHVAALSQALPEPVYSYAKASFERTYARTSDCPPNNSCWHAYGAITVPFAFSADGAFQRPQMSRVVDFPLFDSLATLRGGFANSITSRGNISMDWFGDSAGPGDPVRIDMPYFVVYAIPRSLVGQTACVAGESVWAPPGGPAVHRAKRSQICQTFSAADVGGRLYGLSIDPRLKLSIGFRIKPTWAVIAHTLRSLAGIAAVAALLVLFVTPNWPKLALFAGISLTPLIVTGVIPFYRSFKYPLFPGGNDFVVHWGYGLKILQDVVEHQWLDALRGSEDVFFFMPGFRYVRALEMAVFGDSAFLAMITLLAMPYLLFAVAREAFGLRTAVTAIPCAWLAFYLHSTKITAMAEGVAYPLALCAVLVAGRAFSASVRDNDRWRWIGLTALLLALVSLLRPNMGIAAVLALMTCLWFSAPEHRLRHAVVSAICFAPVGLLLAHNLAFSNRFVLATTAADHETAIYTAPATYARAITSLLTLKFDSPDIAACLTQLRNWLLGEGGIPVLVLAGLFGVLAVRYGRQFVVSLLSSYRTRPLPVMMAAMAIGLEPPLFFYGPNGRYAYFVLFLLMPIIVDLAITTADRLGVPWPPRNIMRWATRLRS